MREVGALVALVGVMWVLAGCGAAVPEASGSVSSAPMASPSPSASAAARVRCQVPSSSALAAIDATVRAAGGGNSLKEGGVLADPDSGMWLIAAPFQGPAGDGEGALGIWATDTDPTVDPFTGTVYSVDGGAATWSSATPTDDVDYDPTSVPVLRCLNQ